MNKSGLHPLGRAVLVEPYEIKKSLIEIPDMVKERNLMVETRARVVEIGPECWKDESSPRAQVGDKVLISKYTGHLAVGPLDGKMYRLHNCNDLFCGIEDET